jgi:small subunit ribosomal protein S2
MSKVPSAIWIVDTNKEHLAVAEARKLNIPVIAILDTNCDPDVVDYPIPGNDDAIRSAALLTKVVASAVAEGVQARAGRNAGTDEKPEVGAGEPLAEWELEQLSQASPAAEATQQAAAETPATTDAPVTEAPAAEGANGAAAPAETEAPVADVPTAQN